MGQAEKTLTYAMLSPSEQEAYMQLARPLNSDEKFDKSMKAMMSPSVLFLLSPVKFVWTVASGIYGQMNAYERDTVQKEKILALVEGYRNTYHCDDIDRPSFPRWTEEWIMGEGWNW